jgi:hypothetical protein
MENNTVGHIAVKALRNSFFAGFGGLVICSFFDLYIALGFIVGFFIGIGNLFMLYNSVRKCIILSPEDAKRKMLISYPIRLILTLSLMGYMVWSTQMSPLTLLAGYIVTLMSMVITAAYISYKEVDPASLPLEDI